MLDCHSKSPISSYQYPYLLWHFTPNQNAPKILAEGLRPRGARRWMQRKRPIWFYNSAWHFTQAISSDVDATSYQGILCAVEWAEMEPGRDFSREAPDVVTLYHPVSPDSIIAHFSCSDAQKISVLSQSLQNALGENWSIDFTDRCTDPNRVWERQTSLAWTVLSITPDIYHSQKLSARLLKDSLTIHPTEAHHLLELLNRTEERFRREFHFNYYATYEFPHLGRAYLRTCGKYLPMQTVISAISGNSPPNSEQAEVKLLVEMLHHLKSEDIALSILELLASRRIKFRNDEKETLLTWLREHCEEAEQPALYLIRHAYDNFLTRVGDRCIEGILMVLQHTGQDYFQHLSDISETDEPPLHFGVISLLGAMQVERALPYLKIRLGQEDKAMRTAAVQALGQIGTSEAYQLVQWAKNDPASQVKKTANRILSNRNTG